MTPDQLELSLSVNVAPRSTTAQHGRSSLWQRILDVPIKHIPCDVEVLSDVLLQEHNPALLTSQLNNTTDYSSVKSNTTLVSKHHVHLIVKEEEHHNRIKDRHHGIDAWASHWKIDLRAQQGDHFSLSTNTLHRGTIGEHIDAGSPLTEARARPLTPSTIDMATMTTSNSAPGSPPPLTESQSSKSSSPYASHLSSPDDFVGGNMNFEEIHLDDEKAARADDARTARIYNRESPRTSPSKRPALSTLQTQPAGSLGLAKNSSRSATTPYSKRNFSSPMVPTGSSSRYAHRTDSKSPAPQNTKSAARLGSFLQSPATSLGLAGRRGSWQPTRKTIHEIEAEYHESDDELPDDASLFNVPMSPFLSTTVSATRSAGSSARGSPERDSSVASPRPIPLDHARTVPDAPPRPRSSIRAPPRQRPTLKSSSTQVKQTKSASASPRDDMRFGRTRSWNLVMTDLNREARIVSEKLDFYYEANSKAASLASNPYRSSAPGAIPLPPVQRGTLDFMPSSKEKEAVLSRTRPSWLPPKDPKEEKRHLEQYKKIMQASIEADKTREAKLNSRNCVDDGTIDSLHRIWAYYVEPTTDLAQTDKRVNNLCWRGIPSKLRGAVWQKTIGNPLGLTGNSYLLAQERVKEIKSRPIEKLTQNEKNMQEWCADIERDAETSFPDLSIFQRNGPQWQDLISVCEAYASYRSDIGYTYGMQLVAALVLLQVPDPADAFILMANGLNKTMPLAFQSGDVVATARTFSKVKSTLDIKFPTLHAYLFADQENGGLGFSGEELLEPMFRTLFANALDLDRLCRVWDIWMFESDRYLIRTAVALLGTLQSQIFEIPGDVQLRRRNIQELLGWGPFGRTKSGYWDLETLGQGDAFVEEIRAAGRLDTAGR